MYLCLSCGENWARDCIEFFFHEIDFDWIYSILGLYDSMMHKGHVLYLHQPALGQVHESICKGAHPEAECLGTFLCLLPCLISAAARSNIIEYYVVDIMLYPVEFCGNRRHDGFSNRGSRGCEDSQRWRRPHERIFIVLWLGVLFVKISLFWFFVTRIFDTVFTESHFRPV